LALTIAMLLLILYSGLRFQGGSITNEVFWLENRTGLRFGQQGLVYSKTANPSENLRSAGAGHLSIELAIKTGVSTDGRFKFLLIMHGDDDAEQLVIGHWRTWLIAMNGDDYDYKRRLARIAVDTLPPQTERFITVTSGDDGTAIFIDGQLAKRDRDLTLKIPGADRPTHLVLGNSNYSQHPWSGEMYGLVYFDHALSEPTIREHFRQWRRKRTFAFAKPYNPTRLYLFNEGRGGSILDWGGGEHHLAIPPKMVVLTKAILGAPVINDDDNTLLFQDMAINVAGFIPLGFLLSALWLHWRGGKVRKRFAWILLACGALSLFIELAQAWIPSRSSQMLDLVLNTLGAGAGVMLHSVYRRCLPPARPRHHQPP
ncbi:MAG: VanZ family protein, partial [Desulfobacterales bacterium]